MHLLSALLAEKDGVVAPLLTTLGIAVDRLQQMTQSEIGRLPKISGAGHGEQFSSTLKQILEQAQEQARRMSDDYTSTEHLMLALAGSSKTKDILEINGCSQADILKSLQKVRRDRSRFGSQSRAEVSGPRALWPRPGRTRP